MRLAQQNTVTSLKEDCQRQMLAAAHTLALDCKNLLDAVDQARVRANLARPRPTSQVADDYGEWGEILLFFFYSTMINEKSDDCYASDDSGNRWADFV